MKRVGILIWAMWVFPGFALGIEDVPKEQPPGGLTDPVEILARADAATRAVQMVRYKVKVDTMGESKEPLPEIEGTYLLSGFAGMGPEKFMIDMRIRQPNSEEIKHITAGGDGSNYFLIDHNAKKAYQDIDPNVVGSANSHLFAGMMIEFLHPTPFKDEIEAKKQQLAEGKTVGDVECYEIQVIYSNDQKATWLFSKDDFLPRGRIDEFKRPDGSVISRQKILSNLEVDLAIKDASFKLELPEGYELLDDFAP